MKITFTCISVVALAVVLAGCNPSTNPANSATDNPNTESANTESDASTDTHDDHGHPEHGPHGGDLVELGKEAFHAELVHGADGVSMYVLDSSATKPVPIAAAKLVVSLKRDGQVASFDLSANPDANDPPEQSSRFTSADEKLDQWLDAGAEGAVVIEIEGKSYTGNVAHEHDHDHDH
ncbi:hypothetical protein Enr13x_45080 [Stieleria neptunia]|uniref:Uncharacterized protein n=1 Tax=Stieleria neptunia TaxID=2527979 RepID=A0A518HUX0_9BACT|nr:hypothetical protein [Stieleria neptunia]QDV44640.1 hypothetical protein Enr13x_45080 [Stieleria neptunia]